MKVVAVCPTCGESRYESTREFNRGDKLDPEAFAPVGDSPLPDRSKPAVCYACNTGLVFRFVPPTAPPSPATSPRSVEMLPSGGTITTLFSAESNEEVREIKQLSDIKYLVVTSRRIILVDAEPVLMEAINGRAV